MKRQLFATLGSCCIAAAAAVSTSAPSRGCCAMPRIGSPSLPPASIRLDRQSALLWHEGHKEHMLLSVKYSGGTDEFAWIVPVESRPEIHVEKGAPFTELRHATTLAPPPRAAMAAETGMRAPGGGAPPVTVLERKEEGPYDIAVLAANNSGGLYDWLKTNRFNVSKDARGALDYYVTHKFVFLAARIRTAAQGNSQLADRLKQGTIAPLHMVYKAAHVSYPLKVTTGNPGSSDMEIYVLNDDGRQQPYLQRQAFHLKPSGTDAYHISEGVIDPNGSYPTLRHLFHGGGTLAKYTATLSDAQRQNDLVFNNL